MAVSPTGAPRKQSDDIHSSGNTGQEKLCLKFELDIEPVARYEY